MSVLIMALSGCQAMSWVGEQAFRAYDENRSRPYQVKYDETKIFPTRNQRLACQLDWDCTKPMSASEFDRLTEEEKFTVINGGELSE